MSWPIPIQRLVLSALVRRQWAQRNSRKNHPLPARLIVSLTSYPDRFDTLPQTLRCLLSQSMAPDRITLWLAEEDEPLVTPEIKSFIAQGLDILYCNDIRSYKKILPLLDLEPDAFIVTADDDAYYWRTWLEELVDGYREETSAAVCHRAYRVLTDADGAFMPYASWPLLRGFAGPANDIFPTGLGGILYPPKIFHGEVRNLKLIQSLCPIADDAWLYFMVRMNGGNYTKLGHRDNFYVWPGSQESALWKSNLNSDSMLNNDRQLDNLVRQFGLPLDIT